jgi:hypothetical protein
MNADTCAVLASVFPLVLITIVLEGRSVHFNLRSRKWFRAITLYGMAGSLVGLVFAVIGVQTGGFADLVSWPLWALFGTAVLALAITVLGIRASDENEDDRKLAKRKK